MDNKRSADQLGENDRESDKNKTTVRRGRPRRGTRPDVPWRKIEESYAFGEVVGTDERGREERRFPTIRELSKEYGVGASLIGYHAKRHNWLGQRKKFQGDVRDDVRRMVARQAAVEIADLVQVLDRYTLSFVEALEAGRLATPTIADIATAIKLKQSLAETLERKEERRDGAVTLESLQRRYEEIKEQRKALAHVTTIVSEPLDSPEPAENDESELQTLHKSCNSSDDDDENSGG